MTYSFDAFEQAFDHIETAQDRCRIASAMAHDIAGDWQLPDEVLLDALELLDESVTAARRALSQASAWLEQSIAYLETESRDDGAGAGGEREGQGEALPDA